MRRNLRHPTSALRGSWRAAFEHSLRIDESWRRRRFAKREHRDHLSFVHQLHMRGDRLLTAPNAGDDRDGALFARLGLKPMAPMDTGSEPRGCKLLREAAE